MAKRIKYRKISENAYNPTFYSDNLETFYVHTSQDLILEPHIPMIVQTGIEFDLPYGTILNICSDYQNALKDGVTVLNSPGIVEDTYSKELNVVIMWSGADTGLNRFTIREDGNLMIPAGTPIARCHLSEAIAVAFDEEK